MVLWAGDGIAYWKIKMTRETKETSETTTKSGIIFSVVPVVSVVTAIFINLPATTT